MFEFPKQESNIELKLSQSSQTIDQLDNLDKIDLTKKENINSILRRNYSQFFEKYELLNFIDSGITKFIYKGKSSNSSDNQFFRFKFWINKNKDKRIVEKYNKMFMMQKRLHHNNISNVLDYYTISDKISFSISFFELGNILYMKNIILKRENLSETFACFITYQILQGLKYLHRNKLFHMNIKEKNIIVGPDLDIKIKSFFSLFSFKNYESNGLVTFTKEGLGYYLSPEVLRENNIEVKYGDRIDIYSLGVTLYKLVFGKYPYGLNNIKGDDYDKITESLNIAKLEFPEGYKLSKLFRNFLEKILEKDYTKRYGLKDTFKDPWVKGWDIINEEKENIGIQEDFINKLITDTIPKFNEYLNENK